MNQCINRKMWLDIYIYIYIYIWIDTEIKIDRNSFGVVVGFVCIVGIGCAIGLGGGVAVVDDNTVDSVVGFGVVGVVSVHW